jgi:hypothetical protein
MQQNFGPGHNHRGIERLANPRRNLRRARVHAMLGSEDPSGIDENAAAKHRDGALIRRGFDQHDRILLLCSEANEMTLTGTPHERRRRHARASSFFASRTAAATMARAEDGNERDGRAVSQHVHRLDRARPSSVRHKLLTSGI